MAASLPDPAPAIVFVTAFDRFALPAFDAAAVDYLLKPVEPERLARALQRLRERRAADTTTPARPAPAQLLVPDRGRTHVLPVAEILWLEAADNYVVVHTAERAPLMRRTLAGLLHDLARHLSRHPTRHPAMPAATSAATPRACCSSTGCASSRWRCW